MLKKIKYIMFIMFVALFFTCFDKVEAYQYCEEKIENTNYYNCGNYVYTYPEDVNNSSIVYTLDSNVNFIYAYSDEETSVFYTNYFKLLNRSYDDQSSKNNNIWTIIYHHGKLVFSGEFKDSWLIDDSHSGYTGKYYDDVYGIYQYHQNGKLVRKIVIRNVENGEINFNDLVYNGEILKTKDINEISSAKEDLVLHLNSEYGVKKVEVKLGNIAIESKLVNGNIVIDKDVFNQALTFGKDTKLKVTVYDYLNFESSIEYSIKVLLDKVSISFSTIESISVSSSRRIVINALAGNGKELDTDYCWYYWSKSPDDSLNYETFLKNYVNSDYKGSYSEDKGVILRNTSGTYYIYALAKDNDSWVVEKSEGYALSYSENKSNYKINDWIFIVSLLILCVLPITIYLYIGKKEY